MKLPSRKFLNCQRPSELGGALLEGTLLVALVVVLVLSSVETTGERVNESLRATVPAGGQGGGFRRPQHGGSAGVPMGFGS